ncbi:hypothetical protein J8M20_02445 [Pseudoalteromonas luteoviolacea]|uniref:hypothetical protein n=1 Tax=Pseudoalteromonas luteoviolacea TaxID=43657 RepID=UPI001B36AB96|nr:hypothetical protein [Pseudoalteromonas luteoviolacea]MBQ4810172.1 hypothetical protein [Pseudoalteromonas luteoviolacea]
MKKRVTSNYKFTFVLWWSRKGRVLGFVLPIVTAIATSIEGPNAAFNWEKFIGVGSLMLVFGFGIGVLVDLACNSHYSHTKREKDACPPPPEHGGGPLD